MKKTISQALPQPSSDDDTLSRKQSEVRNFRTCFFVLFFPLSLNALSSGPGTGHNELWYLQGLSSWLALPLFLMFWQLSKWLPAEVLTKPIIQPFSRKIHKVITWCIVISGMVFFICYPFLLRTYVDDFRSKVFWGIDEKFLTGASSIW